MTWTVEYLFEFEVFELRYQKPLKSHKFKNVFEMEKAVENSKIHDR